jgi:phage regulator Rha-like protein
VSDIIVFENFEGKLVEVNNQLVLVANDVAELYGVKVEHLNRAVKRNLSLFPKHYYFQVSKEQKIEVMTQCHHLEKLKFSSKNPYVFTEEGLYMVATVLQSERAKQVHFHIVETFSKLRKAAKNITQALSLSDEKKKQELLAKSNSLINQTLDIHVIEEKELENTVSEVKDTIGINLGFFKLERTIVNKKK